jgi:predicted nuclease of restriction endonuclease-like RecB superfamily
MYSVVTISIAKKNIWPESTEIQCACQTQRADVTNAMISGQQVQQELYKDISSNKVLDVVQSLISHSLA